METVFQYDYHVGYYVYMGVFAYSVLTVCIARIIGFFAIEFFPFIYFDNLYHLYYGLILIAGTLLWKSLYRTVRVAALGIGLGLVADDIAAIAYYFSPAEIPIQDYWGPQFLVPLGVGMALIYFFRERIARLP